MEIEPLYNFLEILKSSDETQKQIEKDKTSLKKFYESVQKLLKEKSVKLFDYLVHKQVQLELLKCFFLPEDIYQKLPVGIQRIKVCGSIYGLLFRIISNWSTHQSIRDDEVQRILTFFKELSISTTEIKYQANLSSPPIVITRKHTAEGQKESPILIEKYSMVVLSYLLDIFDTNITRSMHTRSGSPKIAAPVEEEIVVQQSGGEKPRLKRAKSFFDRTEEQEEQEKQDQKKQKNIFGYECTYVWLIRYITDGTGSPDVFLGLLDGLIKEVVERDNDLYQRISDMVLQKDSSSMDEETKEKILLQLYLGQGFKNEGMEGLLREKFEYSVARFLFLQKNTATLLPRKLSMPISNETIFSWMGILDTLIGQLFYKSSTPEGQDLLTCYMEKFKDTDTQNFLEWLQKMVLCLDEKDDAADLKEEIFGLINILINNFVQQLSPPDRKLLSQYITTTMSPTNIIQSFQKKKTDYSTTGLVMFVLFILLI
jgi:hypothetical protein